MSAAPKWTPGPWTMETVRTSVGVCFKVGPFPWKNGKLNHACIYADYPGPQEHATAEANARLIAHAPDLYDALAALAESMRAQGIRGHLLDDAEYALRKARGEA